MVKFVKNMQKQRGCGMGYGGRFAARIVGGGVPDAPQWGQDFPLRTDLMWGCRVASPLAAVAVCGGGKVPGRDESPLRIDRERDLAVSCGPGMPGPYRAAMGKRDVAASWRAAYMRPLQMPGRLAATIVGGRGEGTPPLRLYTNFTQHLLCRGGVLCAHTL